MNWGIVAVVVMLVALLGAAVFFLVCRRFEEGLVGNFSLGFVVLPAVLALLLDVWNGRLHMPDPAWCFVLAGVTIFLLRYAYRTIAFHWAERLGLRRPRDVPAADAEATVPMAMKGQRGYARAALMPLLAVIGLVGACATTKAATDKPEAPRTFSGICALKPIGQDGGGLMFVLAHCEEQK